MILAWLIVILLTGSLLAFIAGRIDKTIPRWIALLSISINFLLTVFFWINSDAINSYSNSRWLAEYSHSWIPMFGISINLAVDGLSLLLLMLTFFLGVLAVLCSWNEIKERQSFYYLNLLLILAGITGVFIAIDLFLFYFFWELMIVPMYFLIGIWGSENRVYSAYKFFIFTQVGGLLMLLSILGLYFIHGQSTGTYTFNYADLLETQVSKGTATFLFLGFMIAFLIKLPAVPFHSWLPDAHSEAPTAGSLILAGLLLKTGGYGIIRFALPLFPQIAADMAPVAMLLGVVGILYGATLAYSQTDIKRLIAYTSVSHMGFVLVGVFAFSELAFQGVVMQLITHGLATGALFIMAGMLKERLHTREINLMGGLWSNMPGMGTIFLLFSMASLGLPGLGSFVAEFLVLLGAYPANPVLVIFATLGLIFSSIYSLRMFQKVFVGPVTVGEKVQDFSLREAAIMAVLSLSIIWLGLYPQNILNTAEPVAKSIERVFNNPNQSATRETPGSSGTIVKKKVVKKIE